MPTNKKKKKLIERLKAVDYECGKHFNEGFAWISQVIDETIKVLQKEPCEDYDKNKFEIHYDHTDCIWFGNGDNRCPCTCSQYRDGWNDSMEYIFRNGNGYKPYVRR